MAERGLGKGFRRRPKILDYLGAGHLPEDDARALAEGLVRDVRERAARFTEDPARTPTRCASAARHSSTAAQPDP